MRSAQFFFVVVTAALVAAAAPARAAEGDRIWDHTYGSTDDDYAFAAITTSDGGCLVGGPSLSYSATLDWWILKISAGGDSPWSRRFGGNNDEEAWSVIQTAGGGFVAAGMTKSYGGGAKDMYLVRVNASGDSLWTRSFGGTGNDGAYGVIGKADGNYLVAGYSWSYGAGRNDAWLICAEGTVTDVGPVTPPRPAGMALAITPNPMSAGAVARSRCGRGGMSGCGSSTPPGGWSRRWWTGGRGQACTRPPSTARGWRAGSSSRGSRRKDAR